MLWKVVNSFKMMK